MEDRSERQSKNTQTHGGLGLVSDDDLVRLARADRAIQTIVEETRKLLQSAKNE